MIESNNIQPNDAFTIEGKVEEGKAKFNLTVKGGPTVSISSEAQAKTIKLVVVGVCFLSTLCVGLAWIIGHILTAG